MVHQISIFAENKKGAVSSITGILADGGINIRSFVTNDSAEFGIIRMLVSDAEKASSLLRDAGYQIKQTPVLAIEIPDEPGSLDRVLKCIERAYVNIDYLYTSFDRISAGPVIVLHSDDMPELEVYLASTGFTCQSM